MIKMNSFENKIAVVTDGAKGIGRAVADAFRREGAAVHIIDLLPGDWFVGDVSDKATLERFAESVIRQRLPVIVTLIYGIVMLYLNWIRKVDGPYPFFQVHQQSAGGLFSGWLY